MDWKDIKPGDKFAVEFTATGAMDAWGMIKTSDGGLQALKNNVDEVLRRRLVSITPKPYEPKVGDMVTWGTGRIAFEYLGSDGKHFLLRSLRSDEPSLFHTRDLPTLRPA